eukprot:15119662-Ditylum_brightwellii.AAC.1
MACHSFIVAIAVLTENTRVVTVTVIVAGGGKSVHFVIAFFIAAAVDFQKTKLVKGVNSYLFDFFSFCSFFAFFNAVVTLALTNAFKSF